LIHKLLAEISEPVHPEYNYSYFLRDLTEFRQKTFTKSTILSAFQKSGMWPPSVDVVLRKLKKFQDPEPELPSYSQKSPGKFRPETVEDIAAGLKAWGERFNPLLSSPSRQNFAEFSQGTQVLTHTFLLEQNDLTEIRVAAKDKQKRKAIGRKYCVGKGAVTVGDARTAISEKMARQSKKGKGKGKATRNSIKNSIEITVSSDCDSEFSEEDLHPELKGKVFGDVDDRRDPIEANYDYVPLK